ncbi:MAG: DsbA family protein [Gammaproteobacteria bacterium]
MSLRSLLTVIIASSALLFVNLAQAGSTVDKKQVEQIVHDYLLNNPQLLVEMSQRLQQNRVDQFKQMEEKARKVIPSVARQLFQDPQSPIGINPEGNVTLVQFFDYQCQHCKDVAQMLEHLQKEDKQLRVVYKELPIFGGNSVYAAKAALAAQKQGKYLAFHDALMNVQEPLTQSNILAIATKVNVDLNQLKSDIKSKAIDDELKNTMQLAQKLGIVGTPSFILAQSTNPGTNKEKTFFIPGATDKDTLHSLILRVRQ